MWHANKGLTNGKRLAYIKFAGFVFRRCNMIRETSALATITLLALLAASGFTQVPQVEPNPGQTPQLGPSLPASILGPQLIVWTQMQEPKPVPQPIPPGGDPSARPAPQQPAQTANSPSQQQPAAQSFTGTITKTGDKFVLTVAGGVTYQLDNQDRAKQYEGKQVTIIGNLDSTSNTLHVSSIQLIS
jgi:Protein of unknown function (DUF5818)